MLVLHRCALRPARWFFLRLGIGMSSGKLWNSRHYPWWRNMEVWGGGWAPICQICCIWLSLSQHVSQFSGRLGLRTWDVPKYSRAKSILNTQSKELISFPGPVREVIPAREMYLLVRVREFFWSIFKEEVNHQWTLPRLLSPLLSKVEYVVIWRCSRFKLTVKSVEEWGRRRHKLLYHFKW